MDAKQTYKRQLHWRRTRFITGVLTLVWFATTFGTIYFARELSTFTVFGWPFSFYMAAQGLTLVYLLVVAVYVKRMRRLDKDLRSEAADVP
jgi:putative solute:sodium symporter small subunit